MSFRSFRDKVPCTGMDAYSKIFSNVSFFIDFPLLVIEYRAFPILSCWRAQCESVSADAIYMSTEMFSRPPENWAFGGEGRNVFFYIGVQVDDGGTPMYRGRRVNVEAHEYPLRWLRLCQYLNRRLVRFAC